MSAQKEPLTPHCYSRPDLCALDWCDQALEKQGADLDRREALARASRHDTISLTLGAQRVLSERLRAVVRSHFWDVRNGHAHP